MVGTDAGASGAILPFGGKFSPRINAAASGSGRTKGGGGFFSNRAPSAALAPSVAAPSTAQASVELQQRLNGLSSDLGGVEKVMASRESQIAGLIETIGNITSAVGAVRSDERDKAAAVLQERARLRAEARKLAPAPSPPGGGLFAAFEA